MTNEETQRDEIPRFKFGRNWHNFVEDNFSLGRLQISREKLLRTLERDNLQGSTFLDIGCGSGLHSLAALTADADRIISFDFDPLSVETTRQLHSRAGAPENWLIFSGSVLDQDFLRELPAADIVYSWGVLHHTGDVWKALENALSLVPPDGTFYVALYSADVQINPTPEFWLNVKRRYATGSALTKRWLEAWYVWRFEMGKRPSRWLKAWRRIRDPKRERGMDYMTDVRDWLGGWPMEFVWDQDVVDFCCKRGFRETAMITGEACSEFVFKRSASTGTTDLQQQSPDSAVD